jgi:hypothetical protein
MKHLKQTLVLLLALVAMPYAHAQKAVASPPATAKGSVNGSDITIEYSSPSVKGRKIWGELVPYDKLWRAGANKSTTFTTTKDIKVEGQTLPAGSYSFFVIPGQGQSTVIFNKVTGGSGTNGYDEKQDQLRATVKNESAKKSMEALTYSIEKDRVLLSWDDLIIPIQIK